MKIRVESFATLRAYTEELGSDKILDVPKGCSVADALALLKVPPDKPKVLVLNGRAVPETAWLREGDHLVFFPPLEGG